MSGGKITTPYPGKYKTVMCRFYNQGKECPYGPECNYAHGKNQLKQREHQSFSPYADNGISSYHSKGQGAKRCSDVSAKALAVDLFPKLKKTTSSTVRSSNADKIDDFSLAAAAVTHDEERKSRKVKKFEIENESMSDDQKSESGDRNARIVYISSAGDTSSNELDDSRDSNTDVD